MFYRKIGAVLRCLQCLQSAQFCYLMKMYTSWSQEEGKNDQDLKEQELERKQDYFFPPANCAGIICVIGGAGFVAKPCQ